MKITNVKTATRWKQLFFLVAVIIAIMALVLFLLNYTMFALITVGIFSIWFLYFHVADYQYIEFSNENETIVLRYYKAIAFGKKEFNAIEFPQSTLKYADFQNSIFGKLSDLTLVVKTPKGIAEYPSVSLSAVSLNDRKRIQQSLNKTLDL